MLATISVAAPDGCGLAKQALLVPLLLLAMVPPHVYAGGSGGAWGTNRTGQTVYLYDGIYVFKNDAAGHRTDEIVSVVSFEGECGDMAALFAGKFIDCSRGVASPLAAAYYRVRFSTEHRTPAAEGPKSTSAYGVASRSAYLFFS
ncbi:hypothetical protein [Caldimonas brevitalea]|nr:hypothetical protein [Caldimonas brevitalea]